MTLVPSRAPELLGVTVPRSALEAGLLVLGLGLGILLWAARRRTVARIHDRMLESITNLATDAIVVMNAKGHIVTWNGGAERIFGYEAREVIDKPIWRMMPAPAEQYAELFRSVADGSLSLPGVPIEMTAARRDGSEFPTEVAVSRWEEHGDVFVLCIFRDISQRKRADAELRASTELAQGVLNGATEVSIIATDSEGTITVFNAGAVRLLGYEAAEVVGRQTPLFLHDSAEIIARALELGTEPGVDVLFSEAREGRSETREWTYVGAHGARVPVLMRVTAMCDDRGELRGFVVVASDLSAQRRAERRYDMANEAFRRAFDAAPLGVVLVRPDLSCLHANPAFVELIGYDLATLREMSMPDLAALTDAETEQLGLEFEGLLNGSAFSHLGEYHLVRADGSTAWATVNTSIIRDEQGDPALFVAHVEDITERRRAHDALVNALDSQMEATRRLEEVDRAKSDFVSMVSHELRTPVTSILGYLELLTDGELGELSANQRGAIDVAHRNATRLEGLISDLLALSRLESTDVVPKIAPVDIGAVVRSAITTMLPAAAKRRQQLVTTVETEGGIVLGDEHQLEQAIVNLIANAVKFTPDEGTITVHAWETAEDVCVSVGDTGIGIPAGEQASVFEKFYRSTQETVRRIQGTGLGLAIVKGTVEQHNGSIGLV
ncbi:MAG TPA: PAS domain S-box protein, partial [Acidimicrobiia bacterium]|nr:PAS domain S-box protein [Acidimicrobiia bacterium]